ncbi:ketoacyl-synt-domain-containing protein, partial [Basidiobolus meristosporus CBS 931.73]
MPFQTTPIAVIGVGCRMPGGATDPSKLWDVLSQGKDIQSEIPKDRFNAEAFYHPDRAHHGTFNVRTGYFLEEDPTTFDANFFSVSPYEAKAIDPQQRLLMEVVYEALENGGMSKEGIAGSDTSVFVGMFTNDYHEIQLRDMETIPSYLATGTGHAIASNRISYFFDLKGPSITLDTGCSSSLVAVHLACQSLRAGESKMSIVAGVNLMFGPDYYIIMSKLSFLSPTGRCHTFDQDADGYARGEGLCSIVLKPLKDAIRDGDPIHAVIRETATFQDGRTPGISMPSSEAQEAMIRLAYSKAGLPFNSTQYFEAHGTGTPAGDPLEVNAIARVFAEGRSKNNPMIVGSVKTTVGHLEGASGLAGLIKAMLCLQKAQITPNLHFNKGNGNIDFDTWKIKVPTSLLPWPNIDGQTPRRASVNSFGYGGTSAHVIMENYDPLKSHEPSQIVDDRLYLIPFSSNDPASGKGMIDKYISYLENEEAELLDLAYTLSCRRSMLPWRAAFVASSSSNLRTCLQASISFKQQCNVVPQIAFVFTGQGGQWWAMGRELVTHSSLFRLALERCDSHLKSLQDGPTWSLVDELLKSESESRVRQSEISQPLCTALQIALFNLWKSWGVEARWVVGHSSGEVAASYAAGILTMEEAIAVAYYRGVYMSKAGHMNEKGGMIAVALSEAEAREFLSSIYDGRVVIACINSPKNVTLSGDLKYIQEIKDKLDAEKVFARILKVDSAFHSHHMIPLASGYQHALDLYKLKPKNPRIPMISSVTGEEVVKGEEMGASYWVDNMVSPVQFSKAVEVILAFNDGPSRSNAYVDIFLELGPHSVLAGPIKEIVKSSTNEVAYLTSLTRNENSVHSIMAAAGKLWEKGYPINLMHVNAMETIQNHDSSPKVTYLHGKCLANLPTYYWNHNTKYWHESRISNNYRFRTYPRHDILGILCSDSITNEPRWRNHLRVKELPWLMDYMIQGRIVFPAVGFLSMALEAARQSVHQPNEIVELVIKDVSFTKILFLDESEDGVESAFVMRSSPCSDKSSSSVWKEFTVYSYGENKIWDENCRGKIAILLGESISPSLPPRHIQEERGISIDREGIYGSFEKVGLSYGSSYRGLHEIKVTPSLARATLQVPEILASYYQSDYIVHPTMLDCCLQLIHSINNNSARLFIPTFIEKCTMSGEFVRTRFRELKLLASSESIGFADTQAEVSAYAAENLERPLFRISGVQCSTIAISNIDDIQQMDPSLYRLIWAPDFEFLSLEQARNQYKSSRDVSRETGLVPLMEKLALYYIRRALSIIKPEEVTSFAKHRQALYQWMKLVDAGNIDYLDLTWIPESCESLEVLWQSTLEECVDAVILKQIGSKLEYVLRGEVEPLQLMLEDDLLYRFYRDALGCEQMYETLSKFTDSFAYKYPCSNILEIGAGTGGATKAILEALGGNGKTRRFTSYTFTDISSGFFEKARETFADWELWMSYRVLDIEKDPSMQGFEVASYDLIVASNVLHATADLELTLKHVRKLLK